MGDQISDLLRIRPRFLRSAHLERDFADVEALRGYVVTPTAKAGFERLANGLAPKSSQRAWRITGDYGTGKSSFALALAHTLSNPQGLPVNLRRALNLRNLGIEKRQLLPVLVTGSRGPAVKALLHAVATALEEAHPRGRKPELIDRLRTIAGNEQPGRADAQTARLLSEAARHVTKSGRADGLLIVIDELGKFLEYAALHPDRQDIYFLQEIAEAASRSGDAPVVIVGLLHQGFHSYAEQLSLGAQKEWEKVAGRYEEIVFDQPLEQTVTLIADALGVRTDRLPRGAAGTLERDMARSVELGWYGQAVARKELAELAPLLYPLHPSVVPVLVRLFSRFGQNERSLYGFLLSDEPFGLQAFAMQAPKGDRFYRIHDLYNYARTAFGHRLALQSFRSHWNQIESVVESFPQGHEPDLAVLKTVAVLNLVDAPGLLATDRSLALAIDNSTPESVLRTQAALKDLQQKKSVLYYRGSAGGYCLWPHTSVNLERAYHEALKAVPLPAHVAPLIKDSLETRPLVARRHYIETGNLRHFRVDFLAPNEISAILSQDDGSDGRVLVALCESELEREEARGFAQNPALKGRIDVLVAVPQPLSGLSHLVAEVQRWEWVARNVPELNHDTYAQEEVARQLASCRQVLDKRIQGYIGLRQFGETVGLQWFHRGELADLPSGRGLLERLSQICDEVYNQAPQIKNELVNRHSLSSAAAAARFRLIERLLDAPSKAFLGMDPVAKPPEMSMYLSVLKAAELHREASTGWTIAVPQVGADPCRVRPVFAWLLKSLEEASGARVRVTDLFAGLRRPPYGVREGLNPLLLAVFAATHEHDVAFYEDGGFVRQMTNQEFQRLIKSPEKFELQYCRVVGIRAAVFEQLYRVLHPGAREHAEVDVLDIIRPLCVFAAQLPSYAQKTTVLSPVTIAVREALLRAEEPAPLLFRHLPRACGCEPFEGDDLPSSSRVEQFVERLRGALDELRAAYPELLRRMSHKFVAGFDRHGGVDEARNDIAAIAERIQGSISEPRLKAFCLRLADQTLPQQGWVESLGSLLCSKPPSKWIDRDEAVYHEELSLLVRLFRRVESVSFAQSDGKEVGAMRIAITQRDGTEVEQVVYLDPADEARVTELEGAILRLSGGDGRLGVLAATRVIWGQLRRP